MKAKKKPLGKSTTPEAPSKKLRTKILFYNYKRINGKRQVGALAKGE